MKVLIDARLLSKSGNSGIEEYARSLISALLLLDKHNSYKLFYNGWRKVPISPFSNAEIINWRIPNKFFDTSSRFLNWPKIDRLIKTDLIFSPHFNILAVDKTPQVVTFHDLSFVHHPYFFSWRRRFWHWLQNARRQAERAKKIIAVSEFTKSDLVNLWNIHPDKIEVIYSGISENLTPPSASGYTPNAKPYFLYLGTIEPRKNLIALIRAFNFLKTRREFKDFRLILAGRQGWLYDKILKEAAHSLWQKDIVFWGQVSGEQKTELYRQASVFVYPSFFEGFGFPPLEAQACGCPVVVTDRTSLPEVLGDSALYVNPWKADQLAETIALAAGPAGEKLRAAGLENARRFSWEKAAEKTLKILNDAKEIF